MVRQIPGIPIVDNFLPAEDFALVADAAADTPLYSPTLSDPEAIWGTNEHQNPRVGKSVLKPLADSDRRILIANGFNDNVFPTNTNLDIALTLVEKYLLQHQSFGIPHTDWAGIIGSVFRFDQGSGLPWHRDNTDYTGAFVLYLHRHWSNKSGGELLINEEGIGVTPVEPVPNRLVLIDSGVRHAVNKVCGEGGPRFTVSGFAVLTDRVPHLLHRFSQIHTAAPRSVH